MAQIDNDDDEWYEVQDELARLVTMAYLERNEERILLLAEDTNKFTIDELIHYIGPLDRWQP